MNVPEQTIPVRGTPPPATNPASSSTISAAVVSRDGASSARKSACDLYLSCCRQILGAGMTVHALVMPDIKGRTLPMNADEDIDLREAVENITGNVVNRGDLVVLLGSELVDDPSVLEAQMLMFAISDIALHLDSLYPASDLTAGWMGKHIGTAATAAAMVGAHPVLRALIPDGAAMETVKTMATQNMSKGMSVRTKDCRQTDLQARPAMQAIDIVCEQAMETHGGYLTLPAAAEDIANAAKMLLLDAMDGLVNTPRPII